MSGTVGPMGYGMLAQLIQQGSQTRDRLTTLTGQASSGMVAETYAGLGQGLAQSLSLKPRIETIGVWQANIDAATGRMETIQASMKQIQQIAADFRAQLNALTSFNQGGIDPIAANARAALGQVANLLNARDATGYVFAGQDSDNPPIPEAEDITASGFYSAIATAIQGLTANGAAATTAATLGIAASNADGISPFSAWLSRDASELKTPVTQVGPNETIPTGLLAGANSAAVSDGPSSTGSYMRDLMRALATIGSLRDTQATDPGFAALIDDTRAGLTESIGAMAIDVGVFGDRQARMADTRARLGDLSTAVSTQLAEAQEVDMATILSKISLVQTQLQTSYRLLIDTNSLSLVKLLQ